jgi:hypothetical protein
MNTKIKKCFRPFSSPVLDPIVFSVVNDIFTLNVHDIEVNQEFAKSFILESEELLCELKNINSKGYLNKPINLPVIKELISLMISADEKKGGEIILVQRNELAYNYLILNLYIVGTKIYEKIVKDLLQSEDDDIVVDLKTLLSNLEIKMPNDIKVHLRRQGIKIIQNIYNGFDTEYHLRSSTLKLNELLSVQLACNVGMYIKLPYNKMHKLKYVHPQTSEVFPKYNITDDVSQKFEISILNSIGIYRSLFLGEHDGMILKFIEGLKTLKLPFSVTEDSIFFAFDLSEVSKIVKFTSVYSSSDLINDANSLVEGVIRDNTIKIVDIINSFTGRVKESESIQLKMLKAFSKRTSRLSYGYSEGKKLSITTVRNLYISCHMTGADLSILSDFDSFKDRLDIVNKCFVTRGLPLIELKNDKGSKKSEV